MLHFFRYLRKKLISQSQTSKFLVYAIGEILLVVIGILIALQFNNWNENRKSRNYELILLNDLDKALYGDSVIIAKLFEPRILVKEEAVDSLKMFIGEKRKIDQKTLQRLYKKLKTDFLYRFNFGPYETIKSSGLDIISNDTLRTELSYLYDVTFPAFKFFIENASNERNFFIEDFENELFDYMLEEDAQNNWNFVQIPNDPNLLNKPKFLQILADEAFKAENSRSRINTIERYRLNLHQMVKSEISNFK